MRHKITFVLALLMICAWTSWVFAQTGTVTGTVTDDEGNPVDSAYVTLSDGSNFDP